MEQKAKKYDELNIYEKAMTNASLEQRLEAMAKDLEQISFALQVSVHLDATYMEDHSVVFLSLLDGDKCVRRDVRDQGDLFGVIKEYKTEIDS